MSYFNIIFLPLFLIMIALIAVGNFYRISDESLTKKMWESLESDSDGKEYDPKDLSKLDLPEIAIRFFNASIKPETELNKAVKLKMVGTFLLDKKEFPMKAKQILNPYKGFVWKAKIGKENFVRFIGSDAYKNEKISWTKFWLFGFIPIVRVSETSDHMKSSVGRMLTEAILSPASLLPQNGVAWEQIDENTAKITFPKIQESKPIIIKLDKEGHIIEFVTQRWSNENDDKKYQWQPFGGKLSEHEEHDGFTIPTKLEIGNHFGTEKYIPFFKAKITDADF